MSQMLIPNTVTEACQMLSSGNRVACAGATNLYVDREKGKYLDRDIVSLHRLKELSGIREEKDGWHIGSLTTFDLIEDVFRGQGSMDALAEAASLVGGPQIRNRGTIGGNILSASPAADTVPVLMALDAVLVLVSETGQRMVSLNGFMKGPGRTAIHQGEILTEIVIPFKTGAARFRKVGKRNALAFNHQCSRLYGKGSGRITALTIAIGSAGPTALRAFHTEELLRAWKRPDSEEKWQSLHEEIAIALSEDISPIDDIRATGSYRKTVADNVVLQLVRELWEACEK